MDDNEKKAKEYFHGGLDHYERSEYDKAIASFTKAIELKVDSTECYYMRGSIYHKKSDYGKAIDDFTKVVELAPTHYDAYYGRGLAHYSKEDYDKAIKDFNTVLDYHPVHYDACFYIAKVYSDKKEYTMAIDFYARIPERDMLYKQAQDFIRVAEKRIEIADKNIEKYFKKAKKEKAMSDIEEAGEKIVCKECKFERESLQGECPHCGSPEKIIKLSFTDTLSQISDKELNKTYDVFICHASEDKEDFVRPLVKALKEADIQTWYDEDNIKWGDAINSEIDKGIIDSKYGILVVSKHFMKKKWTQYEQQGAIAKHMENKFILPIWHNVTKDDVTQYSPSLALLRCLDSSTYTIPKIVGELKELLKN